MISQLFKTHIPNNILFKILEENAVKDDKCYIVNYNMFKKSMYNESMLKFIEECRPYYFFSKQKYLDRKLTYKSFLTILRQICNYWDIKYTFKIKYDKSVYDIEYYVSLFTPVMTTEPLDPSLDNI
jgi:hypothetical protein